MEPDDQIPLHQPWRVEFTAELAPGASMLRQGLDEPRENFDGWTHEQAIRFLLDAAGVDQRTEAERFWDGTRERLRTNEP